MYSLDRFSDDFFMPDELRGDAVLPANELVRPTSVFAAIEQMRLEDEPMWDAFCEEILNTRLSRAISSEDIVEHVRELNKCHDDMDNPVIAYMDKDGYYNLEIYVYD